MQPLENINKKLVAVKGLKIIKFCLVCFGFVDTFLFHKLSQR